MKTTIDIPDSLYKKAKILAIERGQTLKQVVLDSLEREMGASAPAKIENATQWANRKLLPAYEAALKAGAFSGGTDSTILISEDREDRPQNPDPKPWMALAGCMANDSEMRDELRRMDKIIEDEFGQVDEADWK